MTVAESNNPSFLFETNLRTRYYLPKTSVRLLPLGPSLKATELTRQQVNWQYLTPSTTTTKCPYKGRANYYNITVNEKEIKDAVWWYEYPTAESAAIQGLVCFYNEKVDVYVDGVLEKK